MYKSENKSECLAQNIRLFCSANNITYKDFAAIAGVGESTINTWLSGARFPDAKGQRVLEQIFGTKFDKLCANMVTANLLLDRALTIEDVFPYNCIISASFGCDSGTDALAKYECSDTDLDLTYRQISPEVFDQSFATLSYREQSVIEMRYRDGLTLAETGKKIGVTRERVRQIEYKAMRKLYRDIQKHLREARQAQDRLRSENDQLKQRIIALEASVSNNTPLTPFAIPTPLDTIVVEDLDFSIRSYNCLKRAQLNTVHDIVNYNYALNRIRNLGIKGVKEIADKIESLDIGYTYDYDANKFVLTDPGRLPQYVP